MERKLYLAIHSWLRNKFGSADKCESPNCSGKSKGFEWSLIKGKLYERKRENFWRLCKSCHKLYDFTEQARLNLSLSHKGQHNSLNTEFKSGKHYSIETEFQKGRHYSPNTEFKKGQLAPKTAWKKGQQPWIQGKEHTEATKEKMRLAWINRKIKNKQK